MMTRQNDFVDCDRHKSRPAAVFEIGPTRTMPQIIISPGTGGKPAFNRPYDCVLIMEDTFDVSAYTYTHKGGSVDYNLPAAHTNAYFSPNDPIDKPRNFTSGTRSNIALLDSPIHRDAYLSIADTKKGKMPFGKHMVLSRYCCGRYLTLPSFLESDRSRLIYRRINANVRLIEEKSALEKSVLD